MTMIEKRLCMACQRVRETVDVSGCCVTCRALKEVLPEASLVCRNCRKSLDPKNYRIADGCPCNSPRGVNHGLVAKETCVCVECDPEQTGSTRYSIETDPRDTRAKS